MKPGLNRIFHRTPFVFLCDAARSNLLHETDTELSRRYELDVAEWYVPVDVVTREVDYPDVTVQVGGVRRRGMLAC